MTGLVRRAVRAVLPVRPTSRTRVAVSIFRIDGRGRVAVRARLHDHLGFQHGSVLRGRQLQREIEIVVTHRVAAYVDWIARQ